jgi:hypothetical protein
VDTGLMAKNLPHSPSHRTTLDKILLYLRAGLSTAPFLGGVAILLEEWVPKSTQKAMEMFIDELAGRVNELEDRMNLDTVNKDEFTELFKSCYLGVIRTTQETKIKMFAGIFANILLKEDDPNKSSYTELDHMVRTLEGLSIGALEVLCRVYRHCMKTNDNKFQFSDVRNAFGQHDASLVMGLINELTSANLIFDRGFWGVAEDNYDNYPYELTNLGKRFVERFSTLEAEPTEDPHI